MKIMMKLNVHSSSAISMGCGIALWNPSDDLKERLKHMPK